MEKQELTYMKIKLQNKKLKKFKKSVDDMIRRWYSYTCPWEKGKTKENNLKNKLTKESNFGKLKKLKERTLKIKQ